MENMSDVCLVENSSFKCFAINRSIETSLSLPVTEGSTVGFLSDVTQRDELVQCLIDAGNCHPLVFPFKNVQLTTTKIQLDLFLLSLK